MSSTWNSEWAQRLEALALQTLTTPWPSQPDEARSLLVTFRDEQGNRPRIIEWLLKWMLRDLLTASDVAGSTVTESAARGSASATATEMDLWRALPGGEGAVAALLSPGSATPMVAHSARASIEVWTETELCALHGAWNARASDSSPLAQRCLAAAAWHVDNLQPDNATNLPWAVHVFLHRAEEMGDRTSGLYAQTLVHNCRVSRGKPDRLSALILLDASRMLRSTPGGRAGSRA